MSDYLTSFEEPLGYLNFASYGPPSRAVLRSVTEAVEGSVTGVSSAVLHAADRRALAAVSRLTGFALPACTLATSTSAGLQQIAFGMPGGEVLVSSGEFPSNLYPWWRAQEAGLLRVKQIDSTEMTPAVVADDLTPATTAVALSAVDFRTGYRADLTALRKVVGDRLLIVDAIQGFGVLDQDWTQADVLVAGGQKWLRAGWGTGFLTLSPRALDRLRPVLGSWTGVEDPTGYDGRPHPVLEGAGRLSVTNLSPYSSAALGTALEDLEGFGVATVEARIQERVDALIAALSSPVLSPVDARQRAGIVVVRVADAQQALSRLQDAGITATAHGNERIRLSVHATTDPAVFPLVGTILGGIS
ncbi:aminotransferase class V-fold PLP-dependent enzyme [Actinoplanes sp. TFC3]|uniref:aminotransferase class V-fold PLP-dependent enzyme n=1 Tax=Actinoplanes sp. TFC3 TaxID=1710355 RepID=UPI0008372472|nr:aminotransferase class V-fold PLP-dependent enzyme [Actinoplanes sp. TFC3]